jgi:hypothetical protein
MSDPFRTMGLTNQRMQLREADAPHGVWIRRSGENNWNAGTANAHQGI